MATVTAGSPADAAGIRPGDYLLAIDGEPVRDVIDYQFLAAESEIELLWRSGATEHRAVVEKDASEPLGLEFAAPTFDGIRRCNNTCRFCFVRSLPKGFRQSLYILDDDYRYSFLFGNFVTLTNLTDADWARLEEQVLSPLRVSVHATDPVLRARLLGNVNAPPILPQIDRLAAAGIQVHAQIVALPGLNDGSALDETLADLVTRHPAVQSIAIVPVGLIRDDLEIDGHPLRHHTAEEAAALIDRLAPLQRRLRRQVGRTLVYLGDEFYFRAERPLPGPAHYDDYPQFENGVGLARSLLDDWQRLRRRIDRQTPRVPAETWTVACAPLAARVLSPVAADLNQVPGLSVEVVPIPNLTFGAAVTVSGLLLGRDVIAELGGRPLGDRVILPRGMLGVTGERTLDDLTPVDLANALTRPIAWAGSAADLLELLR